MYKRILSGLLFSMLLLHLNVSMAQLCAKDETPETISLSNFTFSGTGQITDVGKQLVWQRCTYGQSWDSANQRCSGNPIKLNWQDALTAVNALGGGWRIPNVKELLNIIDYQCFAPPLHPVLFPEAPSSLSTGLWSSTPLQTNITPGAEVQSAWVVELGYGKLQHQLMDTTAYILLVRDAP